MLMDIVILKRDLDFLEQWRPYLEGFHPILVQDGDPDKYLKILLGPTMNSIIVVLSKQPWVTARGLSHKRTHQFETLASWYRRKVSIHRG